MKSRPVVIAATLPQRLEITEQLAARLNQASIQMQVAQAANEAAFSTAILALGLPGNTQPQQIEQTDGKYFLVYTASPQPAKR